MPASINLSGKNALVFGIADGKSIAWNIAKRLNEAGCRIGIGCQERYLENVKELAKQLNNPFYSNFDVRDDNLMEEFFQKLKKEFETVDFLIHSIAFAKKEHLRGKFIDVDKEGFMLAHHVSAYSLIELLKRALPLMKNGGSVVAITYIGSEKVVPGYNVMGAAKASLESSIRYLANDLGQHNIRVNGISPGPIATSAASAISGFNDMLMNHVYKAPLKRKISQEEVADCALFLCSDLSRAITGQIIYVDGGYNIMA